MKSQSNSQDPEAINYLPHTQEPPQKGAALIPTSIADSQSELDKLLNELIKTCIYYHSNDDSTKPAEQRAKTALLQLALSCLPERVPEGPIDDTAKQNSIPWETGFNAAIDTMERNMRAKFQ